MPVVGRVAELWRHPVKSLVGERLAAVAVDLRGVVGDRRWAVTDVDGKLGSGKSSRRFRRMDGLLELTARGDPTPTVTFPDGRHLHAGDPPLDVALSDHVGRPVRLRREDAISHFDDGPLHLVTSASMGALARHVGGPVATARMRPNLVVDVGAADGFVEDAWVERTLRVGRDLVVRIGARMPRCVMVELPQVGLPAAPGLLDTLGRVNDTTLGVVAEVVQPGTVAVGDAVELSG